jgi:hypothetical protein
MINLPFVNHLFFGWWPLCSVHDPGGIALDDVEP